MIFLAVFYVLATSLGIYSNTVTSPQIRNVATKASETRLIPHRVEYQNTFPPYFRRQNQYDQTRPLKSYVIYDEYPLKIFKEWKANSPAEFPSSAPQRYLELRRQQNVEFPHHFQNGQQIQQLPPPNPTLAYRSVYSNIIKVFDNSLEDFDQNRFQSERYVKPFEGGVWKSQNPIEYEPVYPHDIPRRQLYHNLKLPENFPKVFLPNEKFHFPSFENRIPQHPQFHPEGTKSTFRYDTYTINYNKETPRHPDEVEVLSEMALKQKNQKKTFLCSFVRVNQRQFPEKGGPCARSDDDLPLIPPEYPDYSTLSDDKIPVEHRREYFQMKRIKRSELNESRGRRRKRDAGFGYGYSGWGSPFAYDNGYEGYFGNNYPGRAGYRNNYNSGYYRDKNTNQGYRNNYGGSRYDDYDDDYQNNDDSNTRGGLTSYLTNGGRRYKNRKNNNDNEEEDEDDNNSNNREEDSEEEMERMNSNRRDTNDRRNNEDSRDRRRNNNNNNNNNNNSNNNNNDEDDYRDNRRNNNRNNNSRRYNHNNSNRRYSDRYDNNNNNNNNNSNRSRYYGNSNGYSSNNSGYGSNYGNYGSNYGGGYGNGGYGSGYGSNGGYGYGGYGNGFGSF